MWRATRSSTTRSRNSAIWSLTSSADMISRRCSKITRRWSFSTSSYFRMFLRISKLRASTFCCAFSSAFFEAEALQQRVHALRTEDAHQVVLQAQEEFRRAWVALTAGAATKLVVD